MAAEYISFPFRVSPNGRVATVAADTLEADAEQVATLILTRPGERVLVPAYGISEPAFDSVSPAELSTGLGLFGPTVTVVGLEVEYTTTEPQQQVVRLTIT